MKVVKTREMFSISIHLYSHILPSSTHSLSLSLFLSLSLSLSLFFSPYLPLVFTDSLRMAPLVLRPLLNCFSSSSSYTPINTGATIKPTYGSTSEMPGASAPPTRDSPIRWASLVLYLTVTTPLIVAMVILAAAGAINT